MLRQRWARQQLHRFGELHFLLPPPPPARYSVHSSSSTTLCGHHSSAKRSVTSPTLRGSARRLSMLTSGSVTSPPLGGGVQRHRPTLPLCGGSSTLTTARATPSIGGVIHPQHRHGPIDIAASSRGWPTMKRLHCKTTRGMSGGSHHPAQDDVRPPPFDRKGRPLVERGIVSPRRHVPGRINKTPYFFTGKVSELDDLIYLHTPETLALMREACVLARQILDLCCSLAKPGVTTEAIDDAAHEAIVKAGACPSPLNYHGFPKSVCSSVNEVACHAIPDSRPLVEGDLVSFDVSVFFKGFHGDNCATVAVGEIDADGERLISATKRTLGSCMHNIPQPLFQTPLLEIFRRTLGDYPRHATEGMLTGVAACRPGACLTDIGRAIQEVADAYGYGNVEKYCGHGVGAAFHMMPFVQHFPNNNRLELRPGMTFTIEPIFTEGDQDTEVWSDGWTVVTKDGGRAAQFEHVVLITESGHEILTVQELPSASSASA